MLNFLFRFKITTKFKKKNALGKSVKNMVDCLVTYQAFVAKFAKLAAAAAALVVVPELELLLHLLRITNCNQLGIVGIVVGSGVYLKMRW